MTRGTPAKVVGLVEVFAPTGTNSYYRLRRTEPDGSPRPTGFPLRAAVKERVLAARSEQRAETNPEALLHPAARGGLWWHRIARIAIDIYRADPGVLMALGGWENEATVLNRYHRTGAEHTERGLALFSASGPPAL